MIEENLKNKAWEILIQSLEDKERAIKNLQQREISLLILVMSYEDRINELTKTFSKFYIKETENKNENEGRD